MMRDPPDPAFTVVIPCRNEASTLGACLHGLRAQDFPRHRFELVVVDGGSTDGGRDLARHAGARVLSDGASGPSGARNVGIRAARAPIVVFTDADCVPRPDWLTRYAEVFAEDPTLAGVAGGLRLARDTLRGRLEDDDAQVRYRGFITSNVAYRRDVLLEVGGFAEDLVCAEDYDLAWRVMDAGHRVVNDPRPVVTHAPPELDGPPLRYLRKQFWYARHDVPCYVRALARARAQPGCVSTGRVLLDGASRLREAAWVASMGAGLLRRSRLGVALPLAAAGASAARQVVGPARRVGEPASDLPALVALAALKGLARGAGTLAGLADVARPSKRHLVRPGGDVSLAPSAPRPLPPSRRRAGSPS